MDAVEFLRKQGRMCKTFDSCSGRDGGAMCELYAKSNEKGLSCADYANYYPEEAVAIVERWAKEHQKKTRQSEFLKMFPRVGMDADGIVEFCPMSMDLDFPCPARQSLNYHCPECRKEYWLEEVDE